MLAGTVRDVLEVESLPPGASAPALLGTLEMPARGSAARGSHRPHGPWLGRLTHPDEEPGAHSSPAICPRSEDSTPGLRNSRDSKPHVMYGVLSLVLETT